MRLNEIYYAWLQHSLSMRFLHETMFLFKLQPIFTINLLI